MFIRLWTEKPTADEWFDITDVVKVTLGNGWVLAKDKRGFVHNIYGNAADGYTYSGASFLAVQVYSNDADKKEIG